MTLRGQGSARYEATTSADGRFAISSIAPGSYAAEAQKAGFVPANKGVDSNSEIAIKVIPMGAITGRVTDADGEPTEGVSVSVQPSRSEPVTTDEKGAFRIGGLPPGKYRVKASRFERLASKPEARTDGTEEVRYAGTWYPGVLDEKAAEWIRVRAGAETQGTDVRLLHVPFVRVSGRVLGIPEGIRADFTIWQGGNGRTNTLNRDGGFELWRLDPGKYVLLGEWEAPNGDRVQTNGAEIEVAGTNIDNIELRVIPTGDVPGRLEFEDEQAKAAPAKESGPRTVRLGLVGQLGGSRPTAVESDDTFRLEAVPAGRYRVYISWKEAYVKSLRLGSTVVDGDMVDLRNGAGGADLFLVLSASNSSVTGKVSGDVAGAFVALLPAEPEGLFFQPRFQTVKADGTYEITGLPPGSYRIVAVPSGDRNVEGNSIVGHESEMEDIDVPAGEKGVKDLKRQAPEDP